MKKILISSIIFFVINMANSQDTSIVSYYPLAVGNVWIYNWSAYGSMCGCGSIVRKKVVSSVIKYSKTYFVIQTEVRIINGSGNCYGGGPDTVRVDSVTGNILRFAQNGNCYLPHDLVVDSLRISKNDTIKTCGNRGSICNDTNSVTLFGLSKKAKAMMFNYVDSGWWYNYVKGIGYAGYTGFGQICTTNLTIRGCLLNGVVYGDTSFLVGINKISSEVPNSFSLSQNYPNPFNPSTKIKFSLPSPALGGQDPSKGGAIEVKLIIYDALGREVATLVNEQLQPGTYETEWDASNYPSGVYFYQLSVGNEQLAIKKMVLIK